MKKSSLILLPVMFMVFLYGFRNYSKPVPHQINSENGLYNSAFDRLNSFYVGNGEFSFGVDLTGLQTFPEFYTEGIPLMTMSDWGTDREEKAGNTFRYQLGTIGLSILRKNGQEISINDISKPVQELNLQDGEIESRFNIEGAPVLLKTVCHPDYDMISVKIVSDLIREHRIKIKIKFPSCITSSKDLKFDLPGKSATRILADTNNYSILSRTHDIDNYYMLIWRNSAELEEINPYLYFLDPHRSDSIFSFSFQFMKSLETGRMQNFGETEEASRRSWNKYWSTVNTLNYPEFTNASSGVAEKLNRISLYCTRIQCIVPHSREDIYLTYNNWFGKFNLELHWWLALPGISGLIKISSANIHCPIPFIA
jgi:protein-glucosylgalactosylhydroxylysine glucosidase